MTKQLSLTCCCFHWLLSHVLTAERTSCAAQSSRDNNSASYSGNRKKRVSFSLQSRGSLIFSGLCFLQRWKTLVGLDAQSTPTWWTRTPRRSTLPGLKRALRTPSSSSRRQQAWGTCLTGPPWRRGRLKMHTKRIWAGPRCSCKDFERLSCSLMVCFSGLWRGRKSADGLLAPWNLQEMQLVGFQL